MSGRLAAAPISWGVCEVPGWGLQLPADRVLREMRQLDFGATELGSIGYLPTDPDALRRLLAEHDLRLTGGFFALPLADPARNEEALASAARAAATLAAVGAEYFVTCPVSDPASWSRPELSDGQWTHLFEMLECIESICADAGLVQALHPHVDSLVETADEIQRVLDNSTVGWVLDTGHMQIGGFDPLEFARRHANRVRLVHLKDLMSPIAARLNANELSLIEAVQAGLFVPLGDGDVPIAAVIEELEAAGYGGWYVIEQDAAILSGEPPEGEGPIRDVHRSVAFLRSLGDRIVAQ